MDRLVFQPAGMERMAVDDPMGPVPGLATFYEEANGELVAAEPVDNTCKWGAGAFVATAPDVAAFGAAMLDGTLLSDRTLELFFQGSDTYSAMGAGAGAIAFLVVDRSSDLSLALLANAVGDAAGPAAQHAFDALRRLFSGPTHGAALAPTGGSGRK
jgi:CubicO group peptidase (beta-lactamase class C family)